MIELRKEWQEAIQKRIELINKISKVIYFLDTSIKDELEKLGFKISLVLEWHGICIARHDSNHKDSSLIEFTEAVQLVEETLMSKPKKVNSWTESEITEDVYCLHAVWYDPVQIEVRDFSEARKTCPVEIIKEMKEVTTIKVNCPELEALNNG